MDPRGTKIMIEKLNATQLLQISTKQIINSA